MANILTSFSSLINRHLRGILGTIVFHLVVILVFLIFKISGIKNEEETGIAISFEDMIALEELQNPEIKKEKLAAAEEEVLSQQRQSNMAANLSAKANEKFAEDISTDKYIKDFRSDMGITDPDPIPDFDPSKLQKPPADAPKNYKPYIHKGPTTISYELENRWVQKYSIPVYKCQGSGEISLAIDVDRNGRVTDTRVVKCTSQDAECLQEAATTAAMKTFFNADSKAPARQQGFIHYRFVAQ